MDIVPDGATPAERPSLNTIWMDFPRALTAEERTAVAKEVLRQWMEDRNAGVDRTVPDDGTEEMKKHPSCTACA